MNLAEIFPAIELCRPMTVLEPLLSVFVYQNKTKQTKPNQFPVQTAVCYLTGCAVCTYLTAKIQRKNDVVKTMFVRCGPFYHKFPGIIWRCEGIWANAFKRYEFLDRIYCCVLWDLHKNVCKCIMQCDGVIFSCASAEEVERGEKQSGTKTKRGLLLS